MNLTLKSHLVTSNTKVLLVVAFCTATILLDINRVEAIDDVFYIVNSSFEYYPGLPIHKSTDLINWELIGYGLHRKAQCTDEVNLVNVQSNGGIHAPTIRFNKGTLNLKPSLKDDIGALRELLNTNNDLSQKKLNEMLKELELDYLFNTP